MKTNGFYVLFLCTTLLLGCFSASPDENTAQAPANGLNFENSIYNLSSFGGCDTVAGGGVKVEIKFLEPSIQHSGKASQELSRFIRDNIVKLMNAYTDSSYLAEDSLAGIQIKSAFNAFSNSYNDFRQEFPESASCWTIEFTGDTLLTTDKLIVYRLDQYTNTGGAHPNSYTGLYLFDSQTGRQEELSTFVSDTTLLLKKAEQAFRKLEKVPSNTSLEDMGYFLPNSEFFLPSNIGFTRKGVFFLYNPYEIAAYARGPIEFTIPYSELKGIVRLDRIF